MKAMTSARMRCASVVAVLGMALAVFAAGARTRQATAEWKAKGVHTAHAGISSASGSLCDSCIWILKTARCEASDPDAQAALISLALSEVCDKLGGELAAQCSQLVPQVLDDSFSNCSSLNLVSARSFHSVLLKIGKWEGAFGCAAGACCHHDARFVQLAGAVRGYVAVQCCSSATPLHSSAPAAARKLRLQHVQVPGWQGWWRSLAQAGEPFALALSCLLEAGCDTHC